MGRDGPVALFDPGQRHTKSDLHHTRCHRRVQKDLLYRRPHDAHRGVALRAFALIRDGNLAQLLPVIGIRAKLIVRKAGGADAVVHPCGPVEHLQSVWTEADRAAGVTRGWADLEDGRVDVVACES
jgi:hypothetical protein